MDETQPVLHKSGNRILHSSREKMWFSWKLKKPAFSKHEKISIQNCLNVINMSII